MSDDDIIFETDAGYEPITAPPPEPSGILPYLQKKGFASTREEAIVLIAIVLIVIFGVSFFLLKRSLPDEKRYPRPQDVVQDLPTGRDQALEVQLSPRHPAGSPVSPSTYHRQ